MVWEWIGRVVLEAAHTATKKVGGRGHGKSRW